MRVYYIFLLQGSELEQKFSDMYQSPLHSAAFYGHLPAIKFLVEKGFDVFRYCQCNLFAARIVCNHLRAERIMSRRHLMRKQSI